MKSIFIACALLLSTAVQVLAGEPLSLKDVTGWKYVAKRISGVRPIKGTSEYAQISADRKKVVRYSFVTGQETGVLFDLDDTKGEQIKSFDGYQMADDGQHLLIETNYRAIYRRSYTADFYVYDIQSKELRKLSKNGAQQIPTFSPDGKKIAFVRKNNIFITDGTTERQVTTDGKFNEVINGIPDWVNEEEFGFNNAIAWSADSRTLSWIRYDESGVKTYSLQIFAGMYPTNEQYKVYPGEYSYKYPKPGEDNSKVTAWVYNLDNGSTKQYNLPLDADGYIPPHQDDGRRRPHHPLYDEPPPGLPPTLQRQHHDGRDEPLAGGERGEVCQERGHGRYCHHEGLHPRAFRPRRPSAPLPL